MRYLFISFVLDCNSLPVSARQRNCRKVMFSVLSICLRGKVPMRPTLIMDSNKDPQHVQTCSTWTSLYRDLLQTHSDSFIVEFSVQGPLSPVVDKRYTFNSLLAFVSVCLVIISECLPLSQIVMVWVNRELYK